MPLRRAAGTRRRSLELLAPGAAYQLLAYGISAPFALGALLSTAVWWRLPQPSGTPVGRDDRG
ncbi:MAG: hypothetical protein ACR2GO_01950 [Candidatus Limnocylindria bacterium]